jgi:lysophospholipase L1-like esterase
MRAIASLIAALAVTGCSGVCLAQQPADAFDKSARWEATIAAFEEKDRLENTPKRHILFTGASSVRRWDLNASYPEWKPINRGYGGSFLAETTHFAGRAIIKHEPQVIVIYSGENDINRGRDPVDFMREVEKFERVIHAKLPKTTIVFLAIKPSRPRIHLIEPMRAVNRMVKEMSERTAYFEFVDTFTPLLGADGMPRTELYIEDQIHLNRDGYKLWEAVLTPMLKKLYRPGQ